MSDQTDIFPGYDGEATRHPAPPRASLTIRLPATRKFTPFDRFQVNQFQQRVRNFLQSLSPARRAEIATRQRFRNQPYLRHADEPDPDDLIF